jgi:hypothetical protein
MTNRPRRLDGLPPTRIQHCPPGQPCHADILLALANPETP